MANMSSNFLDTLQALGKIAIELDKNKTDISKDDFKPEVLTKEKLQELKWMNTYQLEAIYGHGKRKVIIDDDPAAYQELKWFNSYQLEAIFGKGEEDDVGNG